MKNNKKKILIYSILGVVTLLIVTLTITYAYWILTRQQTGENVVNTACLNINFTGENDITLDKAYPMNEEQLESFLENAKPYHFTIHNECNDLASASINLESLTVSGKALEDEYIDAILYEDDYNSNLNTNKKLTRTNDENKVISDAKHAYSLYNFTLKANEERDFNLLLYMDPNTPMVDANMNASWKGKITLSTEYKEDSKMLRKPSNSNSMWQYDDKLTKIVLENTKSVKEASDGGQVYGPFDESEYGTNAIQSYVVCETDEKNCIGYLQSDGKIIANTDSTGLFRGFTKLTEITGLENLDTSNVTNMSQMFAGCGVTTLDLKNFNTKNVTSMNGMFTGMSNLISLDLSKFDTRNVSDIQNMFGSDFNLNNLNMNNFIFPENCAGLFNTSLNSLENLSLENVNTTKVVNMSGMFAGLSRIQSLDLSDFDTTNVTNMSIMFAGATGLQSITFGPKFVHKPEAITSGMFSGCPSQDRPTDESWQDVSF